MATATHHAAPNPRTLSALQTAMQYARSGNFEAARKAATDALSVVEDRPIIWGLLGIICCQAGDFAAGTDYLRQAWDANPHDMAVAVNLANALVQAGSVQQALDFCSEELADSDPSMRIWRLRGYASQILEDFATSAEAYARVTNAAPDDFESWNNLGNARAALGDIDGSLHAMERAIALRPDITPIRLNHASTLINADRQGDAEAALKAIAQDFPADAKPLEELAALYKQQGREKEALAKLEDAHRRQPEDVNLRVKLGIERQTSWDIDGAVEMFESVIQRVPNHSEALLLLGILSEQTNRIDRLRDIQETATRNSADAGATAFLTALLYRRDKRFDEGLAILATVPDTIEPIRRAQLEGQFHDRMNHPEEAFAAFERMNELQKEDPSDPQARAAEYMQSLRADSALVSKSWVESWSPFTSSDGRSSPAFLVGFPRSGTTLLDTLLMGHPDVSVLEERPPISVVERTLGSLDRLPELDAAEIEKLRAVYFEEAARYAPVDGKLLVDKFPLHLNKVPIIRRLFPDAKFILALRHPCDAVLSCFITNFRLNNAMANCVDLQKTAELYDVSFGFWQKASELLHVPVHAVRYENMVEDVEGELRPLFDYLGLDWNEAALDHQHTAQNRGTITTASYAQVTEPIYQRSAGRWSQYRKQLEPVLPVLQPWIDRFGYDG